MKCRKKNSFSKKFCMLSVAVKLTLKTSQITVNFDISYLPSISIYIGHAYIFDVMGQQFSNEDYFILIYSWNVLERNSLSSMVGM